MKLIDFDEFNNSENNMMIDKLCSAIKDND